MHYLIVLRCANRPSHALHTLDLSPCSCVNFEKRYVNHEIQVNFVTKISVDNDEASWSDTEKIHKRQVLLTYDKNMQDANIGHENWSFLLNTGMIWASVG